jgi:LmbE family N-acetylglucosaminyl deacetylase
MTRRGLRKTLKAIAAVLGVAAALTVVAALIIQFRIRIANDWQQYAPLPEARAAGMGDSIIVFAPHCDDETLGCGGMLSMAAANGARARVALITNGDGYRIGVARAFGTIKVTPAMCIRYAYQRQRETLAALSELGVPATSVTFLGYPDRGIAALWNDYWGTDRLYVSESTRSDRSPYSNSYTPRARYCGESLISDIESLIRRDEPTDVYIPHPSDNHPDHYATYCFVTAAIAQLGSERGGLASRIRMHTYLVHRGDWPVPRGDHANEPLAPPHALARGDTKWYALPLAPETTSAKRTAITRYKTQMAIERGFLMSFVRRNEVFGDLPVRTVASVADGTHRVDGRPDDWHGIPPVVVDPVGDYVVAGMNKGGDVRAIYLCRDKRCLYVRVDCVGRLSKRITYTVNLRGLAESKTDDHCSIRVKPPRRCWPAGTTWAYRKNVLEIAVPAARFDPGGTLFVQALTRLARVTVDDSGWHEVAGGGKRQEH